MIAAEPEVVWQPLPQQRVALASTCTELLFGGSKGGGKSDYLIMSPCHVLDLAARKYAATGRKQMKCRVIIFRKNLEDARDLVAKTHAVYPTLDPLAQWHEKERFWRFDSGASVEIRHLDGPHDHEGYNGNEFTWLCFDEVQFISWEAYSFLVAQLRSSDPEYRALIGVRCTANPGGPHGDWVRTYFHIDAHPQGGKIFSHPVKNRDGREVITTRVFLRSYLKDNYHLDPDGTYEARLRSHMTADEVRMYLDGDFDCVAGAFFSSLIKPPIHFQKSKPIPNDWEMLFGIDWGSTAPACWLLGARDRDNRVWIIDELHRPGITGRTFGEAMKQKYTHQKWCKDKVWKLDDFWGVIDRQAMDRYGSEATAAAGIQEWGFRIFEADKLPGERKVGIEQMKERLLLDRADQPQLIIFEDRCPNLVAGLKAISSCAPEDPEDYDPRSPHAHALDAMRFILMKWPVRSVVEDHPMDAEVARWNRILQRQRKAPDSDDRMVGGYDD